LGYDVNIITVNQKQDYHNCEMIFSFFYHSESSGFVVEKDQKYKIYTTLKEVEILNEALHIYQEDGFKEAYLLFAAEKDGSAKYPDFVPRVTRAHELSKVLQDLSHDEDSLVQLSEYCIETPPTYKDDFGINKQIEAIIVNGQAKEVSGYQDLKTYISNL